MSGIAEVAVRLLRRRPMGSAGPLPAGVCRAPFTSMYLDQHGSVRACCQNLDHPLGNVRSDRLADIWTSAAAGALRDAMVEHNLDLGCAFCKWQVDEENPGLVFARTFDHLEATSFQPVWPRQLELSLSNACNLQCIMCNGDWSSSIRANRERRPPLPVVYDDRFFEDLRPFLEHVEVVKILGGEPFLGKESLRVMEMLVELGSTAEVHVTTNGTQWSPRVQRILERLPMVIVVSLDGIDAESYEAIRLGSDLTVVLENLSRFQTYAAGHGTAVNLAHCLMTSNWRGFPDFLRFAEERQLRTYVNTVTAPIAQSLFHLPRRRLAEIVAAYDAQDDRLRRELVLNRALWIDQLERLHHRLDALSAGEGVDYYLGVHGFKLLEPSGAGCAARSAADAHDEIPVIEVRADLDLVVTEVVGDLDALAEVPLDDLAGRTLEDIQGWLAAAYGEPQLSVPALGAEDLRSFEIAFPRDDGLTITAHLGPIRDDDGAIESFVAELLIVRHPGDSDGTAKGLELVRRGFLAAHDHVHELAIDPDGTVLEVRVGGGQLAPAIGSVAGSPATDVLEALGGMLGEPSEVEHLAHPGTMATTFVVRYLDGAGTQTVIEALHMPVAGGGGSAEVLVAARR